MEVEEKIDERPGEAGAETLEDGEPRSGQLGRGLEIQDVQLFADFPVRPRRKGKLRDLPPFPDLDVVTVVVALGHGIVAQVGNGHDNVVQARLHLGQFIVQLPDPGRNLAHFGDERRGLVMGAGLFQLGNLL